MATKLLTPAEALAALKKKYAKYRGVWLAFTSAANAQLTLEDDIQWPLSIPLGAPTEKEASENFKGVQAWVSAWRASSLPGIQWTERRWSGLGAQTLPTAIVLNSPLEVAAAIGEKASWLRASGRYDTFTLSREDFIRNKTLEKYFPVLAEYSDEDFSRLRALLNWLFTHPESNLYIRQLPIEGVDTKWLEKRKGLVTDLLAVMRGHLPEESEFYSLCGIRKHSHRIRMRVLDAGLRKMFQGLGDLELPLEDVRALQWQPQHVLIVENKETGVALTDLPGTVVFMGLGNAVDLLKDIPWLQSPASPRILYWGDIDTHGFAILSRAKGIFPNLASVLMDETTVSHCYGLWGSEPMPHAAESLPHLNEQEAALYDGLKRHKWAAALRMEQERVPFEFAMDTLAKAFMSNPSA